MTNPSPALEIIYVPTLRDKEVPERKWLVRDWIPMGSVTLLSGDGGVGKSLLCQQLLTCAATETPFLGLETRQVKTFGVFCEDTADELHRRQVDINAHYELGFDDLEYMYWSSRVGQDNILMGFGSSNVGNETETYKSLHQAVMSLGAQLIVIDTAADTFGGNEIIRSHARQFINLLSKLALEIEGAVILCAHPSANGILRNDGTSGSTAWNNTVRSRLYLSRPRIKDEKESNEESANGLREFEKRKANYASAGDKIILRWEKGVLRAEGGPATDMVSQIEKRNREREDDEVFMLLLDQFNEQGRTLSESSRAGNYAPKLMLQTEKGKSIGKRRLTDAMSRLFDAKVIDRGYVGKGSDRKQKEGIRRRPCEP